jgi:hypothetical protein
MRIGKAWDRGCCSVINSYIEDGHRILIIFDNRLANIFMHCDKQERPDEMSNHVRVFFGRLSAEFGA